MGMLKHKRSNKSSSFRASIEALENRTMLSVQTVAQYNFNALGTGGTTVADISNDGFNVQYAQARTLSTDNPFGESNNDSISVTGDTGKITNHASLNLNNGTNTFTIEGWIKPSSAATDYIAQLNNTGNDPIISLGTYSGGVAYARFRSGGTEYLIRAGTVVIGGWNYMAMVYDGSAMHLYLQNSNYPSLTDVGDKTVGATVPNGFGTFAYIATEPTAGAANTALFDDIRLSSGAASTAELGYQASFGAAPPAGYLDAATVSPGWSATDATAALQAALDTGSNVWVPKEASAWIVGAPSGTGNGINLTHSNQAIEFDQGVVVSAKKGAFLGTSDCLFSAKNLSNVTITGYSPTSQAQFYMNQADYGTSSQHRHGLNVLGCSSMDIENLGIYDTGGDGIYLGKGAGTNTNITINNVACNNDNRNGISVITANGLTITNSEFDDTNGTAPEAGIDIEPNANEGDQLTGISISNCTFANDGYEEICVSLHSLSSTAPPLSISFDSDQVLANTTGTGNDGILVEDVPNDTTGSLTFTNMDVNMITGANSIRVIDKSLTGARVSFGVPGTSTPFGTIESQGTKYPIALEDDGNNPGYGTYGGIDLYNVNFAPSFNQTGDFMYGLYGGTATAITDLQGSFYFQNPANTMHYTLTGPQTNVNVTVEQLGGTEAAPPVAQYDFDSITYPLSGKTTAADLTANAHDITWSKTLSLSTNNPFGQSGDNSISVLGATGIANNTTPINLGVNNTFTVEGWLDPSAIGSVQSIAQMSGTAGHAAYIYLQMDAGGHAYGYFRTNSTTYSITGTDTLVTGGWNYLVLTFDGTTLRLSELNSNHPTLTQMGSVSVPGATLPTQMSTFQFATAVGTNAMLFDDIRLSDTVLSDAQLGYHGSFSSGASPQLLQSAVALVTAAPPSGGPSPADVTAFLQPTLGTGSKIWMPRQAIGWFIEAQSENMVRRLKRGVGVQLCENQLSIGFGQAPWVWW